jgi:predicted transcriptional regulator
MSDSQAFVEKTVRIPADLAERLGQTAQAQHMSENELIAKALYLFFSLSQEGALDRGDWMTSSEAAFSRVWDNEADARYDNWREMYGASAR